VCRSAASSSWPSHVGDAEIWSVRAALTHLHEVDFAGRLRVNLRPVTTRRQARPAPVPVRSDTPPSYRLGSSMPEYWLPVLPGNGRLLRGAAPRIVDSQVQLIEAPERLLEPGQPLSLYEEEVPREGIVVTRRYRHLRSADGRAVLWIGRQKRHG